MRLRVNGCLPRAREALLEYRYLLVFRVNGLQMIWIRLRIQSAAQALNPRNLLCAKKESRKNALAVPQRLFEIHPAPAGLAIGGSGHR